MDNGSRSGLIVNWNDESGVIKKYGSVNAAGVRVESSITSSTTTERRPTRNSYTPVIVENPVVSDYDDDDLDANKEDNDEYNPFDTDSFKRRERHATFHGWGKKSQKSQTPPPNQNPEQNVVSNV
jgi:hypothetical protein